MMVAQRFRAIGYVAMVAFAAVMLYLISSQVAAERGRLVAVERQIADTRREMRRLQTELGTRASMRQLERWNGEVLALSAPTAEQYVRDGAQLAALTVEDAAPAAAMAPPVALAAARPAEKRTVPAPRKDEPEAAPLEPALAKVPFVKPVEAPRIQKVSMTRVAVAPTLARELRVEKTKRP